MCKKRVTEESQFIMYLRIIITAFRLLSASRFASHRRMYFWKITAAFFICKYRRLANIHFHLLWIIEAISCFFIWKASSVSNSVLGNRINNFVLHAKFYLALDPVLNIETYELLNNTHFPILYSSCSNPRQHTSTCTPSLAGPW